MFYPQGKNKKTQIVHQLTAGFVKILIRGKADQLDDYRDRYEDKPIPDLEIQGAGKSVSLVLPVPEIDPLEEGFSASSSRVDDAMNKLVKLISLANSRGDS